MTDLRTPSVSSDGGFTAALKAFHRRWRTGLLAVGLILTVAIAGGALVAAGVLDYYLAFGDTGRLVIFRLLMLAVLAGLVWVIWRALAFSRRESAVSADATLANERRAVLSASELLDRSAEGPEGLHAWLQHRAVQDAAARLHRLTWKQALPKHALRRALQTVAIVLLAIALIAIFFPRQTSVISRRLLDPTADVPPYSPLMFAIGPKPAEVVYGSDLIVLADISGGALKEQVRCLTRDPLTGKVDDSPAFQESLSRFSRKLEKVAANLEIAFATGRARSAWLPVSVLLQPKVHEVLISVSAPPYTKLPRREFPVGAEELAAIPGSRITAVVTSNRPLSGGLLRIESSASDGAPEEVAAQVEDIHRVKFSWVVRQPARLALNVRDVLGTTSAPVQLDQKVIPDERPRVALRQPAGDVLATPDIELPLDATASDDLGLSKVTFVRQLVGYRERAAGQPVASGEKRFEMTGNVKLSSYGLVPGQVIELVVEAGDTNPNLLGVSVSDPARIHIIAREKYAELLRNQITLEDFNGRYDALRQALEEARKALEELEKAAQTGDQKAMEEARKKAQEAHRKAGQTFGQLAKDFPLFELDEALSATTGEAMKQLLENSQQLDELKSALPGEMLDAIPQLKERLGASEQQMAGEFEKGDRASAAASIFEHAGNFRELVERQKELVKDYDRILEQIRRGETKAGDALRDVAKTQREISSEIQKLSNELESDLNGLPDEFAKLKDEGRQFLEGLRELEVSTTMDEGAAAAEKGDGKVAGERADEALARLEALLRRKNGFCEMCRGEGDPGFPWPQDLSSTLQQLMRALTARRGSPGDGEGEEPGGGSSGAGGLGMRSDSGYSMRGKMPQLPIYGPSRMRFSRRAGPQTGGGDQKGAGTGEGRPEAGADVDQNQINAQEAKRRAGEGIAVESVPEAYREALKRYFSSEETQPPAGKAGSQPPAP